MNSQGIPGSQLVLNPDGSIYHLCLLPEHVCDHVILVGDPGRVKMVSSRFDEVTTSIHNREFFTETGKYRGKDVMVISTGIGPDNIDIVMNELDAVANIDLLARQPKNERRKLTIVRIGTSGSIQPDITVGSHLVSDYGLGLDGLLHFYDYSYSEEEKHLTDTIIAQIDWHPKMATPYVTSGNRALVQRLGGKDMLHGITVTAPGFYGPQGRKLVLPLADEHIPEKLRAFKSGDLRITNFEMETSALYGLGNLLGHDCCTCCAILANRYREEYVEDHDAVIDDLIVKVLDRLIPGQAP